MRNETNFNVGRNTVTTKGKRSVDSHKWTRLKRIAFGDSSRKLEGFSRLWQIAWIKALLLRIILFVMYHKDNFISKGIPLIN